MGSRAPVPLLLLLQDDDDEEEEKGEGEEEEEDEEESCITLMFPCTAAAVAKHRLAASDQDCSFVAATASKNCRFIKNDARWIFDMFPRKTKVIKQSVRGRGRLVIPATETDFSSFFGRKVS